MSSSGGGSQGPSAGNPAGSDRRRRGRRPEDFEARRARVLGALADLEAARVPFSMADLAERAGISRATLYRDAGLRDLVGSKGDGPRARPVDARTLADAHARAKALAAEQRTLRRALRNLERRLADAQAQTETLEAELLQARRSAPHSGAAADRIKAEAYAAGFAAGAAAASHGAGGASLLRAAARLPRPALLAARRSLARALHPDLFARDPAASLLATELLKQINALVGSDTPQN